MRGILFDLDGVLYNSDQVIEGAAETVSWVQRKTIPHLFVTNTTSRGRDALAEKLHRFGICTDRVQILTPCVAASEWMRAQIHRLPVALFVPPKALGEFEGLETLAPDVEKGPSYVVIGDLGDAWDYRTLNRAFRLMLSSPESELIALGMTLYWHAADGLRLDVAPFVAALECATGRKARIFAKPAEPFFLAAALHLGLPPGEIVMVGDGIETDVAGAQNAGLKGLLVRTGKFRISDLHGPVKPDAVLDSIRDLPQWWDESR